MLELELQRRERLAAAQGARNLHRPGQWHLVRGGGGGGRALPLPERDQLGQRE